MSTTASFDLSVLKRHAFTLTYGNSALGPLESEPKIEPVVETYDCTVYENGSEALASFVEKNEAKVTVTTKNVAAAIALIAAFRKGDNLMASANRKALTFTPIVASGSTEKTLTFTDASLQPDLSYVPSSTRDHTAKLVFKCVPNATTGALFSYI